MRSGSSPCEAHLYRASSGRGVEETLCGGAGSVPSEDAWQLIQCRGVPPWKWVTLVIAEERGGVLGASSCGYIYTCCDEMVREIVQHQFPVSRKVKGEQEGEAMLSVCVF